MLSRNDLNPIFVFIDPALCRAIDPGFPPVLRVRVLRIPDIVDSG